jgi:hypothetical protein
MVGLLNVRLSEEDERRVAELRAKGIQISSLVRRAIRVEAEAHGGVPADIDTLRRELEKDEPRAGKNASRVDMTDRHAVQRAIRRRLRRRNH